YGHGDGGGGIGKDGPGSGATRGQHADRSARERGRGSQQAKELRAETTAAGTLIAAVECARRQPARGRGRAKSRSFSHVPQSSLLRNHARDAAGASAFDSALVCLAQT